jgi:hypothetical protein
MSAHLVSSIDTKDFGGEIIKIGDFNRDGFYELLFVQSDVCTRDITCLTVTDIHGNVLWQTGEPSKDNSGIYSDLAIQVYDWDGDGNSEILYVEQAIYAESIVWDYSLANHIIVPTSKRGELKGRKGWAQEGARRYEGDAIMHVLDASSGVEKTSFPIPAPADDCFAFANLTGTSRRQDLIVKDRYWNTWGIAHNGDVLWHWAGNPGHYPAVADIDNDGLDEVFVGFYLLDHDGRLLWELPGPKSHQDSSWVIKQKDETRLVFSHGEGGDLTGGVRCIDVDGKIIWHKEFGHAQMVIPGRYYTDQDFLQFAVADLGEIDGNIRRNVSICILDWDGKELYRQEFPIGATPTLRMVNWLGGNSPQCLILFGLGADKPAAIIDGYGKVLDELPMIPADGRNVSACSYVVPFDILGDTRDEVILTGKDGLNIYVNTDFFMISDLYNSNVYGTGEIVVD